MKHTVLILLMAASAAALSAQTPAKPASHAAKPAVHAARSTAAAAKLPPGVPPVKGIQKTLFTVSLRYQEIKIGTGAEAEPNKLYKVNYTVWLAASGVKSDSSYDQPGKPVLDKDGKPVLGADGKPTLGEPQPITFPQGFGRAIPGFDQGFTGMKIGGKRRLFIPWQLAYGARGRPGPDAAHPGIPPKADLIFDVELVAVEDLPMPPNHPGMMPGMHAMPGMHPMTGMHSMPGMHPMPGAAASPAERTVSPGLPATPDPARKTVAPAAPAAPTAPAKPAAPGNPEQPK
jgi:peptidylprolyl isomerase